MWWLTHPGHTGHVHRECPLGTVHTRDLSIVGWLGVRARGLEPGTGTGWGGNR